MKLVPVRGRLPAVAALACLCALPPLFLHHRAVDASRDYAVEDYARNMFASLEPGATLLTYQWDNFVSAAYFLQLVEGHRTDVVILERELLRRSWYLAQLERNHPRVLAESRAEVDAFLKVVRPFERGEAYDGAAIQAAFEAMIASMLHRAALRGPVYFTSEARGEYLRGFRAVPSGLAFRLVSEGDPMPVIPARDFTIRPIFGDGRLVNSLRAIYAAAYVNQAYQQGATGNPTAVNPLLHKALAIRPGYPQAVELLRRVEGR
jgi:hypothetical protein